MARIHGVAGEWARVKGMVFGLWPLFLGLFACGFSAAFLLVSPLIGSLSLVLFMGFILMSLSKGLHHVERFFKGARGEERVAAILQKLPDAYHVFNDFSVGRRHVDHVVVGPGGIFAVETKFWRGRVTIEEGHVLLDGQLPDREPLRQALQEATVVRRLLAEAGWNGVVSPVLVFASDVFVARRATVGGVTVMNSDELCAGFESGRTVLTSADVDRLVGIIESYT